MIFGLRGGKFLMKAGKFVNCACCDHTSPCNAATISDTLDFTINYGSFTLPVTLTWAADACAGATEGWAWDGPDTAICPGLDLREVSLCCSGTTWNLTVVVVNCGIQDALANPSFFPNLTTVSSSPMHLTTTSGAYNVPCQSLFDPIAIDIQAT